jgi:hypothetical protein
VGLGIFFQTRENLRGRGRRLERGLLDWIVYLYKTGQDIFWFYFWGPGIQLNMFWACKKSFLTSQINLYVWSKLLASFLKILFLFLCVLVGAAYYTFLEKLEEHNLEKPFTFLFFLVKSIIRKSHASVSKN